MTGTQWQHLKNAEQVAQTAVQRIIQKAHEAISRRGVFKLVLTGGTTPKRIYQLLSQQHQQWSKWHLFIGDERCLDVNDPERNSLMIQQTWLSQLELPDGFMNNNFHPIRAELGPKKAASDYAELIEPYFNFDLTLLGMGEDGHTASLFPGHSHNERELTHAVYNSPKPPSERVSLSLLALSHSDQILILITGKQKQEAVKKWQQGETLPIAQIRAANTINVLIDNDAQP